MRRGVGLLFLLGGLTLIVLMSITALKAGGALAWLVIDAAAWSRLLFGQFVLVSAAPILYVALGSWSSGSFQLQALIDALVGLLAYLCFFTVTMLLLVSLKWLTPWLALWPGFFLLWYGFRLRRGKQFPMFELR